VTRRVASRAPIDIARPLAHLGGVMRVIAVGLLAGLLAGPAGAAETVTSHGLSAFGDLKYPADFTNFEYVNPEAPKGGELRFRWIQSYDNLNPYILKGTSAVLLEIGYDTLMTRAADEPDALYGLVASRVTYAKDRTWAEFTLRPEARWRDGVPITAQDVAFSFRILKEAGHPSYRILYADIGSAEAIDERTVLFSFHKSAKTRDLPLLAAQMPILPAHYWKDRAFAKTTLDPPLTSGPYVIEKAEAGRYIRYRRDPDYWGKDLPVNLGRYNFDYIQADYYRDRNIALEAFFSGEYDFREEFTSKHWVTGYDKPPVRDGLIIRDVLPDETPSGVQAFFLNSRRTKFKDRRVRAAMNLAFDFGWTNKNIFHDLYKRTTSMFENSTLAAKAPPSDAELAILEAYRGRIPDEAFEKVYAPPETDGSGNNRRNLRQATKLLKEAGYGLIDGKLVDQNGQAVTVEFLTFAPTFERVIAPYIRNLKRLGIEANIRLVDIANYENRLETFDFDVVTGRFVQSLTPGIELRNMWSSDSVDIVGTRNLAGIKDPVVDELTERIIGAKDREELTTLTRALDRVLMWHQFVVPHWYKGSHTIAYWDKFARPAVKPKYARGVIDTWWVDADKAPRIAAAQGRGEVR
jgi:microcin C transport system substrate-binding protein